MFQLQWPKNESAVSIIGYEGEESAVLIPAHIDGLPVRWIGPRAFKGRRSLKTVTLPDTLRAVGEEAFYSTGLTGIRIPDGLKKIGPLAFGTGLNRAQIQIAPNHPVFAVDQGVLYDRSKTRLWEVLDKRVAQITIPRTVEKIEKKSFYAVEQAAISFWGDCLFEDVAPLGEVKKACLILHFPGESGTARLLTVSNRLFLGWLKGNRVDIEGYDNLFLRIVQEELKLDIALLRLSYPARLSPEGKGRYLDYIKKRLRPAFLKLIQTENIQLMEQLAKPEWFTKTGLGSLLDTALSENKPRATQFLMDFKHRYFQEERDFSL